MMHTPVQHLPVPARTAASVDCGWPSERKTLASEAGPQREPFDCQAISLPKVLATGSDQARSTNAGVRVTDVAIARGGTFDWATMKEPAPTSSARRATAARAALRIHRIDLSAAGWRRQQDTAKVTAGLPRASRPRRRRSRPAAAAGPADPDAPLAPLAAEPASRRRRWCRWPGRDRSAPAVRWPRRSSGNTLDWRRTGLRRWSLPAPRSAR